MNDESPEQKKIKSETFNRVAEDYDRFRPGYPESLIEEIITESHLPANGRILDVGCGTGKAAFSFARRGYAIHCLDTGESLIEVARRNLASNPKVTFEIADFNKWKGPEHHYDLVISAQAWHWMDPEKSYANAARVLKPGGSLALVWNKSVISDTPVFREIQQVYQETVPDQKAGASYNQEEIAQTKAEFEASGYFLDIQIRRYPWSQRYNAEEFLGLLNTFSDHILLPEATRQMLYQAISEAIQRHGGYVDRPVVAVLFLAKKK